MFSAEPIEILTHLFLDIYHYLIKSNVLDTLDLNQVQITGQIWVQCLVALDPLRC